MRMIPPACVLGVVFIVMPKKLRAPSHCKCEAHFSAATDTCRVWCGPCCGSPIGDDVLIVAFLFSGWSAACLAACVCNVVTLDFSFDQEQSINAQRNSCTTCHKRPTPGIRHIKPRSKAVWLAPAWLNQINDWQWTKGTAMTPTSDR